MCVQSLLCCVRVGSRDDTNSSLRARSQSPFPGGRSYYYPSKHPDLSLSLSISLCALLEFSPTRSLSTPPAADRWACPRRTQKDPAGGEVNLDGVGEGRSLASLLLLIHHLLLCATLPLAAAAAARCYALDGCTYIYTYTHLLLSLSLLWLLSLSLLLLLLLLLFRYFTYSFLSPPPHSLSLFLCVSH